MKFKASLTVLTVALAAGPLALQAESKDMKAGRAPASNVLTDSPAAAADTVLAELHRTNLMEIEMGKLAKSNGESASVKKYGEMLVTDHEKAEKKVQEVADQMAVKLPEEDQAMAGAEHAKMAELKSLKGAAFDKAFAQGMATDHQQAISKLEDAQAKLSGATAALVADMLPVLRKHQETAKQLAMNPAASSTKKTQ